MEYSLFSFARNPLGMGLSGWVVENGKTDHERQSRRRARAISAIQPSSATCGSALAVPLEYGGRYHGRVVALSQGEGRLPLGESGYTWCCRNAPRESASPMTEVEPKSPSRQRPRNGRDQLPGVFICGFSKPEGGSRLPRSFRHARSPPDGTAKPPKPDRAKYTKWRFLFPIQPAKQPQNLRLRDGIQRAGRLIGQQANCRTMQ